MIEVRTDLLDKKTLLTSEIVTPLKQQYDIT